MPEGGRQGELMPERAGRAKPFLIIAPIIAFALLVVAIVVAVAGPGGPGASPDAAPSPRSDAGHLVLAGPGVTLRYAELSPVLPGA